MARIVPLRDSQGRPALGIVGRIRDSARERPSWRIESERPGPVRRLSPEEISKLQK